LPSALALLPAPRILPGENQLGHTKKYKLLGIGDINLTLARGWRNRHFECKHFNTAYGACSAESHHLLKSMESILQTIFDVEATNQLSIRFSSE